MLKRFTKIMLSILLVVTSFPETIYATDGTEEAKTYTVHVANVEHGSVKANPTEAEEGHEIRLSYTEDEGY